jgi:hypothetical protein
MSAPRDPSQVVDDRSYEFLARQMGITFPAPPHERSLWGGGDDCVPTMVYPDAISLLSVDAIGLYCKLRAARARGAAMDIDIAAEAVDGDEGRAWMLLDELASVGCVIAPEYAQALADERKTRMQGGLQAVRQKRKRGIHVPDPFPEYLPASWSAARVDFESAWDRAYEAGADTQPRRGHAVVYFLLDAYGCVLYVGSTGDLDQRLYYGHRGKPWTRYEARRCATREDAYWREAVELITKLPPLNSPHENVNGRLPALRKLAPAARPGGAVIASRRIAALSSSSRPR